MMAELNIDGQPIFVDVDTDPNFPILYTRLIQSQGAEDISQTQVTQTPAKMDIETQVLPQTSSNTQDMNLNDANQPTSTPQVTQVSDKDNPCLDIQTRRIRCPECKRYTAETEEKMLRHIRKVHRGEDPFQCYMCDYTTYNKAVFEEHVRVHQGIKPFKCSKCDYRSASKKNTKKHEQIHRPDNPLKCDDCDFIARNNKALQKHVALHRNEEKKKISNYQCANCSRNFETKEKHRFHLRNQRKCKSCSYMGCTFKMYAEHLSRVHKKNIETKKKQALKLFNCAICSWGSNSKPRTLLHLIHHPNQKVDEEVVDIIVLRNCGIMK